MLHIFNFILNHHKILNELFEIYDMLKNIQNIFSAVDKIM